MQGFWSEINGATLQDLMYNTGTNYEAMSKAISMRGAGQLAGSILGKKKDLQSLGIITLPLDQ